MDSRKPLTAGEIEELKNEIRTMPHKEFFGENLQPLAEDHSRLLSLLAPPPDAAVREAVERVQSRSESKHCHEDSTITFRLADIRTLLRAVQAPRLTTEQVIRLRDAADTLEAHGEVLEAQWLRAAFPEAFAVEVGRG